MSPPLLYVPAYFGLFIAQLLAMTCNSFLDIQYRTFGTEVLIWAIGFGLSLTVGCLQRGKITRTGKTLQTIIAILGFLIFFGVLIRIWGSARAAVAFLAVLQIAYNCVTVTRRHLHLGLLISAVMVIFAASHYRANWSMLFYLLPYLVAVVWTLVAEQISRRADDLKKDSLGEYMIGGQGVAIAAATAGILLLGGLLYAITPQVTWQYLDWRYGQLVPGHSDKPKEAGSGGSGAGASSDSGANTGQFGSPTRAETGLSFGLGWLSPADMRKTANATGMPEWQRNAIRKLADLTESAGAAMQPLFQSLENLWEQFKKWMAENRDSIKKTLFALLVAALMYAFWRLMREVKIGIWILAQIDYLRLGICGFHAKGRNGARQYYTAMERLLSLQDAQRIPENNTREYLAMLSVSCAHLKLEAARMTALFEDACYGPGPFSEQQLRQMRIAYRDLYKSA
jgi:hypothetical protein